MIEVVTDPATVARVHRELLIGAFRPSELVSEDELVSAAESGDSEVVIVRHEEGIRAAAVGERYGSVMLLAYLAVAADGRGGGLGGEVLDFVIERWISEPGIRLVLAEIDRPDRHAPDPRFGDPARRLEFYARRGALALDLPYFQPSLADGLPREHGLLLIVLGAHGETPPTARRMTDIGLLREFLVATIGAASPGDRSVAALYAALDAPGGVQMLDLRRYAEIAASSP